MNRRDFWTSITLFALAGCGKPAARSPAPLSVAEWQTLPVDQKYTARTLERLKEGDPKLHTPEGWEAFSHSILARERKKDFPKGRS